MDIRFIRPSLLLWCVTVFASLTACANQPREQPPSLPILPAHLNHKADGSHELIVEQDGLVYSAVLERVLKHVHKGKGNHTASEYFATVRASDGQEMRCKLRRLEINATTRCVNTTGTQYQLQEQKLKQKPS